MSTTPQLVGLALSDGLQLTALAALAAPHMHQATTGEQEVLREIAELEGKLRLRRLRAQRDALRRELDCDTPAAPWPNNCYGGVRLLSGPCDVNGNPVPSCR